MMKDFCQNFRNDSASCRESQQEEELCGQYRQEAIFLDSSLKGKQEVADSLDGSQI